MLSALRSLLAGVLLALGLLAWGAQTVDERALVDSRHAWRRETTRWLGAAALEAADARARRAVATITVGRDPAGWLAPNTGSRTVAYLELVLARAVTVPAWALLLLPAWAGALLDGELARRADSPRGGLQPARAMVAARVIHLSMAALPVLLVWPLALSPVALPLLGLVAAVAIRVGWRHRAGELR